MRKTHPIKALSVLAFVLSILATPVKSQEILNPSGLTLSPTYQLSSTNFSVTDTISVIRVLTNSEPFPLQNLYLVENLPDPFVLVDYRLTINGNLIPAIFTGPAAGEIYAGYDCYRWIIDSPEPWEPANRVLSPGERLELTYRFVAPAPGGYSLPFHSLCFYGNAAGYFTTAPTIALTVAAPLCSYIPGDANGNGIANGLDIVYMVNYLKGGPPPVVNCYCPPERSLFAACDANGNCVFNGSDVIYIINFLKSIGPPLTNCPTCPPGL